MNNSTLNKDINLIERENGYWDYEFQYGDIVQAENNQSLRNGLIIACLTSWNYLNHQENSTYSIFGNRAYEKLKKIIFAPPILDDIIDDGAVDDN